MKQADNENPPYDHNDEQRDDALREILIFRHCLVPLTGICASNPDPGPPPHKGRPVDETVNDADRKIDELFRTERDSAIPRQPTIWRVGSGVGAWQN